MKEATILDAPRDTHIDMLFYPEGQQTNLMT